MWDLAAAAQLATAQAQLASANASVASGQTQLQAARTQLAQGQNQLSDSWNQLANGKTQLDAAREQLETSKTVLDKVGATLGKWEQTGITGKLYEQIRGKYDMAINQYNEACAEYNRQLNAYNAGLQQYQNAVARLDQGSQAYRSNADNLAQASKQIAEKQNELGKAVSQAGKQVADGVTQLIQGQRDIDKAETEYQSKLAEFNAQKPEAERQITLAEEKIDNLTVPAYSVSGRREGLTSQGYRVYMVIEGIVAKLADIFPIFLYFVAALVTFSTMGRMVDEERTNSGTLKALGYGNTDVMLKFTVYGFAASTLGTCIGVLAGHTLLPLIVAHAYSAGFTMPDIMLKFHPWITMAAFALAWISAVVPAWLAASKELREKPASLLLPKPPAKGSKILLEHFPPLWNRLNFTHKVTARNIFRYKTRMFMTIFGVCGAVSLLTAGLAVQSSIGQIGNRQFEELIHYDLIVAEESDTNSAQREEIATTLKGKTVQSSTAVRYEELSKTAGKENDKQSITLLATDDAYNFNEYLTLRDRKTHQPQILVNNGAVISERLAEMLNVSVGDTFTVNDENGAQRTIKVAGISEMYIGHFIFMNAQCYEHVFGDQYSTNAYMVRLKDHSNANTERQGAKFMKLAAVRGVVQNTTQKNMVSTIVGSLNQIMEVLILVAVLLAPQRVGTHTRAIHDQSARLPHQRDHDVHLPRNDPAVTAGHTRRIRLRRMAAPIHHHRSATRRSHVRPRHQQDRIGGPDHRRGRGTSRARLDRIPPARNGGHARSIEISGMTLHETVSGAARQKPGEQPRRHHRQQSDARSRSPESCPHAHTDADDAIRAAPTRWPSRRQAHAYTRRPRRPPEPKPDRRTACRPAAPATRPTRRPTHRPNRRWPSRQARARTG